MRLLNIEASPRGARSVSIAVSGAFIAAYRVIHPDIEIDTLNVWNERLPEFDSQAIGRNTRASPRSA